MIGIIWNCQGLRKQGKIEFLKELICDEKADFIGLQETMKKNFSQKYMSWKEELAVKRADKALAEGKPL